MKTIVGLLVTLVLMAFSTGHSAATGQYTVTDLNGDCVYSDAYAVNNVGNVVGACLEPNADNVHTVLWNQSGQRTPVGALGGDYSIPTAINDSNTVVGYSKTADGNLHGFVWTPTTGIADIGSLGGGFSTLFAINSHDVAVGQSTTGTGETHAIKWTPADGLVDLGTFGGSWATAYAINDSGVMVLFLQQVGNQYQFYVYNPADISVTPIDSRYTITEINNNGVMTGTNTFGDGIVMYPDGTVVNIPTFGGSHTVIAVADALNEHDQVAAAAQTSSNAYNPLIWSSATGSINLGLPAGFTTGYGEGINDQGVVVGGGEVSIGIGRHALLWAPAGNTSIGSNVSVTPVDTSGSGSPVTLAFGNVTSGGSTTLTTSSQGQPPPSGFKIGSPAVYYDLVTTATFTGSATLCINYTGIHYGNVNNLKLFHLENGVWVDRTSSLNTSSSTICATVTSFSPFAIFETSYNFSGFFHPIDNLPTLNGIKAGTAAPVKFSLGGNQGFDILKPGSPASVVVTCDNNSPVDAVDETVTAGSSSLSYDASSGQYIYVWKTDKSWVGTCRQLNVTLSDGSSHIANFKFSK